MPTLLEWHAGRGSEVGPPPLPRPACWRFALRAGRSTVSAAASESVQIDLHHLCLADAGISLVLVTQHERALAALEAAAGGIQGVAGRSGSGKSTLLALLAGWTQPDSGAIERVGVWAADGAWARWDRTSIIPQVIAPITELSMIENVALPLRLGGLGWGEARTQAAAVLTAVDLDILAERPVADASLGQQQRLGVARAVVVRPTLLLADEPSSHQGPEHAALILAALRGVADAGGAVLIATHDEAVAAAADRVIALNA